MWSSVWPSTADARARSCDEPSGTAIRSKRCAGASVPLGAPLNSSRAMHGSPSRLYAVPARRRWLSASMGRACQRPTYPSSWMASNARALRTGHVLLRTDLHVEVRPTSSRQGLSETNHWPRRRTAPPSSTTSCPDPHASTTLARPKLQVGGRAQRRCWSAAGRAPPTTAGGPRLCM